MRCLRTVTGILVVSCFLVACGNRDEESGDIEQSRSGRTSISHYVIHQPDSTYGNDNVIIWKGPDREKRASRMSFSRKRP